MGHSTWSTLYRRAGAQGGVVTSLDAAASGIPKTTFHRRIAAEEWRTVFQHAWLVPGAPISETARHWAALLTSGTGAALSHTTAANLLQLHRPPESGAVHVVRPYGLGADDVPGLVRHRSRSLEDRDSTTVDALTVTTAARTILDLADEQAIWQLEAMMLTARQRRLLDLSSLVDQHERRKGLAGAGKFLAASKLLGEDGADSILERRARRQLQAASLHPTPAPHPVQCGGRTFHVDIAFPEHRFGIECDGFSYHDKPVFERDRKRWRLIQDNGWRLTWLTWRRLHEEPAAFIAEVRGATRG